MAIAVYRVRCKIFDEPYLRDTLKCIRLAMEKPAAKGELRSLHQFTEVLGVSQMAEQVRAMGTETRLDIAVQEVLNAVKQLEDHSCNPVRSGLLELGLESHSMTTSVLIDMLQVERHRAGSNDPAHVLPPGTLVYVTAICSKVWS